MTLYKHLVSMISGGYSKAQAKWNTTEKEAFAFYTIVSHSMFLAGRHFHTCILQIIRPLPIWLNLLMLRSNVGSWHYKNISLRLLIYLGCAILNPIHFLVLSILWDNRGCAVKRVLLDLGHVRSWKSEIPWNKTLLNLYLKFK